MEIKMNYYTIKRHLMNKTVRIYVLPVAIQWSLLEFSYPLY